MVGGCQVQDIPTENSEQQGPLKVILRQARTNLSLHWPRSIRFFDLMIKRSRNKPLQVCLSRSDMPGGPEVTYFLPWPSSPAVGLFVYILLSAKQSLYTSALILHSRRLYPSLHWRRILVDCDHFKRLCSITEAYCPSNCMSKAPLNFAQGVE